MLSANYEANRLAIGGFRTPARPRLQPCTSSYKLVLVYTAVLVLNLLVVCIFLTYTITVYIDPL